MRVTPVLLVLGAVTGCAPDTAPPRLGIERGPFGAHEQAVRACADGPTRPGIDVSFYQGVIDWPRVAASGEVAYAIVRIGDGLGEDDQFERNWAGARDAGLIRGAYQFFRTQRDPEEMAAIVVRKLGRLGPGDLPAVLDLEGASIQGQPANVVQDHARRWLQAVEAGTGKRPIIYTGYYVWRDEVNDPDFSQHPLWIAAYTDNCPLIPDTWPRWTFWQFTDSGRVPGIDGNVDQNRFNGDQAALEALAGMNAEPRYGARYVAQSYPLAAMPAVEVRQGEVLEGYFDLLNTGTAPWDDTVYLAPTPRDTPGPFACGDRWVSETRISRPATPAAPGETVRFDLPMCASQVGETIQYFGMVRDDGAGNVRWFSDEGGPRDDLFAVKVKVLPGPDGGLEDAAVDAAVEAPDAEGPGLDVAVVDDAGAEDAFLETEDATRLGAGEGEGDPPQMLDGPSGIASNGGCAQGPQGRAGVGSALLLLLMAGRRRRSQLSACAPRTRR